MKGTYTALVTPMMQKKELNCEVLERIVDFQVEQGIDGILALGTTGESPTLSREEHDMFVEKIYKYIDGRTLTIVGTGGNNTKEALERTKHAEEVGAEAVLLVDPYYNGPSSMEIRKEYVEPIATAFPNIQLIPYVIPGRTGTKMLPQDLAILHSKHSNVRTVKEATGDLENMKLTRQLCGQDFDILSGDDNMTYKMMSSQDILANGVVSVSTNVVPRSIKKMVDYLQERDIKKANELANALKPLFDIVTVKTSETTPYGSALCKARNPLPYKTLMNVLGMSPGPCRQPLGKMTRNGIQKVLDATRTVYENNPEILEPVESFFDVDLSKRLYEEKSITGLFYR